MKDRRKKIVQVATAACFGAFIGVSVLWDFAPGREMGKTFARTLS